MFQDVPEGDPNCLAGLTFVISGTLDRLVLLFMRLSQACSPFGCGVWYIVILYTVFVGCD